MIPGSYTYATQPCSVVVLRWLNAWFRKNCIAYVSSKCKSSSVDQRPPILDRRDELLWEASSFSSISPDCFRAVFRNIDFTNSNLSPPATPYPATPFLFFENPDGSNVAEIDAVG